MTRLVLLFSLLLALLLPVQSWAVTAKVQSASNAACCSQTSLAVVAGSNLTAGNSLALFIYVNGETGSFVTISSVAVTSCQTNTMTFAGDNPRGASVGDGQGWAYFRNNITGGSCTITVTVSGTTQLLRLILVEISGTDTGSTVDKHVGNYQGSPGNGTDAITTTAVTPTANGAFFAAFTSSSTGSTTLVAGTGFGTAYEDDNVMAAESQTQTTAASLAGTFTQTGSGNNFVSLLMVFAQAGGASEVSQFRKRRLP